MRRGEDISVQIEGVVLVHQNYPGLWVREHQHEHHEMFIPLSGSLAVTADQVQCRVEPGQMLWLPGDVAHTFSSAEEEEGERLILMFEQKMWKKHAGIRNESCVLPASQLVKEIFYYLMEHRSSTAASALIGAMVTTISEQMAEAAKPHPNPTSQPLDERVEAAMTLLQKNFVEEISIENLADKVGITSRTLSRLFAQQVGLSPKQVLTKCRIQEACRLLKTTPMNITDVAFECGFGSLSRFIEAFRIQVGVLPSDYRNQKNGS